jgi:CRP-like cAMP-binding protein
MIHPHFLQELRLFQDVDPETVQLVAQSLVQQDYQAGEVIVHQDTPSRGLFFLIDGEVGQVHEDQRGNIITHRVIGEGSTFGAWETLRGEPWGASYTASTDISVALWPRPAMSALLDAQPNILENLNFQARSQRLLMRREFSWLKEEEAIFGATRKHPVELVMSFFLPVLFATVAIMFLLANPFGESFPIGWLSALLLVFGVGLAIWRWIDWGNDFNLVTNRRAILMEKVVGIYDNRQETPLQWVLSVSVSTRPLGRLLGYGDVIIRTYTGKLVFHNTTDPQALATVLEEQWDRYKKQRLLTDQEEMAQTLQEHLGRDVTRPVDATIPVSLEEPQGSPSRRLGFRLRYQDGNVVTYRKHWAILVREVATPTILFFLVVIAILARVSGVFGLFDFGSAALLSGGLVFMTLLWWMYRYLDWANDIYQITPTHIVDISKKPFSSEVRLIAPLDNILGTEVERQGILGVMLNFGAVIANVGTSQFVFYGVPDPVSVQQDIVFAQDALLQQQAEEERLQRRDEMVEWLSAYHKEIIEKDDFEKGHAEP